MVWGTKLQGWCTISSIHSGDKIPRRQCRAPLGMSSADVDLDRLMPYGKKDYHENNHRVLMIRIS